MVRMAMLHRWGCSSCKYVVWAPKRSVLAEAVRNHLVDHNRDQLTMLFRTRWSCPRCGTSGAETDPDDAIDAFSKHLLRHEVTNIASEVGFFDTVDEPTAKLMSTPRDSKAIEYVRRRTISNQDAVVFVSNRPQAKLAFLEECAEATPRRVALVVPEGTERAGIEDDHPFDVIVCEPPLRLETIGATVSELIQDYDLGNDIAVDFELLGPLDDAFGSKRTFEFLHLLIGILNRVDISSIYSIDQDRISPPSVNVYGALFELAIAQQQGLYTIVPSSKAATERKALVGTA